MRYLYKITNLINGKAYIGQSKDYKRRWQAHRNGEDRNSPIHMAIKKYGKENFEFKVLAILEDYMTDEAEVKAIKAFNTQRPHGYNIESGGNAKKTTPEETKRKISESKKGHKMSEEYCKRLSERMKGHPVSEETRRKLSLAHKGKSRPKRGPMSEATKNKIGKANKGKKRPPCSDETRLKISKAGKGRKCSPEHIKKSADARRGKPSNRKGYHLTDEHKAKIGAANKGRRRPDAVEIAKKYLAGRPAWNKGKTQPKETKDKVSEGLKEYYKQNPEALKRLKNQNKGRKATEESKIKRSEKLKNFYAQMTPEERKEYIRKRFKMK